MQISNLTPEFIEEKRYKSFSHKRMPHCPASAWIDGWYAAVKFAKKMEKAIGICEQCGKVIMNIEDFATDSEGAAFCAKCYDKLFKN